MLTLKVYNKKILAYKFTHHIVHQLKALFFVLIASIVVFGPMKTARPGWKEYGLPLEGYHTRSHSRSSRFAKNASGVFLDTKIIQRMP